MRLLVVMNPSSCDWDARRRWPALEPILRGAADVTLVETEPDDAKTLEKVKRALAEKFDRVCAIGGDGTVHLTLNAIFAAGLGRLPELAVIPFGTSNDVARSLDLPLHDLPRLAAIAAGPRTGKLDVPRVRAFRRGDQVLERIWVDAVSIGMDADVVAKRGDYRELKGILAYAAALLERTFHQRSTDVRLEIDGERIALRVFNVIVNNVPIYAGTFRMPEAERDDGVLDVYLFDRLEYASKFLSYVTKKADVLGIGVHEMLEDVTQNQRTLHGRVVRVELLNGARPLQIDGEAVGLADEVRCEIVAQLRVAIP